jgi:hypothetical protein
MDNLVDGISFLNAMLLFLVFLLLLLFSSSSCRTRLPFFPKRPALFFGKIVPFEAILNGTGFLFALYLLNRNIASTTLILTVILVDIFGSSSIGLGLLMECPLSFRHHSL